MQINCFRQAEPLTCWGFLSFRSKKNFTYNYGALKIKFLSGNTKRVIAAESGISQTLQG